MKPEKAYRELIVFNWNVEILRKRETNVDEKTTCWRWEPNPHLPHYVCCAWSIRRLWRPSSHPPPSVFVYVYNKVSPGTSTTRSNGGRRGTCFFIARHHVVHQLSSRHLANKPSYATSWHQSCHTWGPLSALCENKRIQGAWSFC